METISLKMQSGLLSEVDMILKKQRYATRTEFIRDAIRNQLRMLEREAALQKLDLLKGKYKGKTNKFTDDQLRERNTKSVLQKFNFSLE